MSFYFEKRRLSPRMEWFQNGQPKEIELEPFNLEQLGIAFILLVLGLSVGFCFVMSELVYFYWPSLKLRLKTLFRKGWELLRIGLIIAQQEIGNTKKIIEKSVSFIISRFKSIFNNNS